MSGIAESASLGMGWGLTLRGSASFHKSESEFLGVESDLLNFHLFLLLENQDCEN